MLNRQFPTETYSRADFSGKDIRGKDLSGVTLQGASFRGVTAGLSQTWSIGLYLLVAFLSILVGILAAYAGALATAPTATDPHGNLIYDPAYTTISLTLSGFAFAIMLLRGINAALAAGSVLVASTAIAAMAFIPNQIAQNAVSVLFAALALAGSIAAVFNMSLAIALTKTLADQKAFLGSLLLALLGIVWGSLLGVGEKSGDWAYIVAAVFGLATLALGTYAGRQAMRGDRKYPLIRAIALALYARGGTSFRGATLTDADFTEASLEGADFRGAILTRTCWFHARNLERARTGGTYLANPYIRQLVVARDGSNLPAFDHLDLREVNLAGANLQKASFIGADLSQATLAGANLSGAKLAKAQLYQTDLSQATLTGANIQDWGISTETKLSNVFCDFIYMRLPTEDDPDACRKPDSKHETFKLGDFTDFISPIVKTLELYHEQNVDMRQVSATFKTLDLFHHGGVDPSAAAVALQQLAERHPEAGLEVVVLEGRGNEKIHLQARVAGDVDRSQLSAEYFAQYEQVKSLPYNDLQELLAAMAEKDKRIQSYEKLLENALQQPKFYVETYQSEGTTGMPDKEIKILVLAASPQDQVRLNLEKEVKTIDLALRLGKHREQFTLDQRWGVSRGELQDILLTIEPDIVHFCGHGAKENGLVLQNDQKQTQLVSTTALAELFELVSTYSKPIPCIVLNACYSEAQADAMSPFIDYIVGMNKEIGDNAAINFSKGFYRSLSNGLPYEAAFRFGRNAIDMESIPEHLTPVLKGRAVL